MDNFLKVAIKAAEEAAEILRKSFGVVEKRVEDKNKGRGYLKDLVTKFDYAAQATILKIITQHFPDHSILAEEGVKRTRNSEYQWLIDPLDGTNNFSRGIPDFAVSIALTRRGKLIIGVTALPYEHEIYWASDKVPTHLNNHKVRVGKIRKLKSALVGVSMLRSREAVALGTRTFVKLMSVPVKPRVFGSIAADLARLSSGKFDALVFNHNNPWDIAAGILLVEKAGGKVSPVIGKNQLEAKQLVASNPSLHALLLKLLRT